MEKVGKLGFKLYIWNIFEVSTLACCVEDFDTTEAVTKFLMPVQMQPMVNFLILPPVKVLILLLLRMMSPVKFLKVLRLRQSVKILILLWLLSPLNVLILLKMKPLEKFISNHQRLLPKLHLFQDGIKSNLWKSLGCWPQDVLWRLPVWCCHWFEV